MLVFGFGIILHGNSNNKHENSLYSLSEKGKARERIGDYHLSKVIEDFVGHAIKLENDLSRLPRVFTFDFFFPFY